MKTLDDIVKLFDDYRANPGQVNGYKILQMLKSRELQDSLEAAQRTIEDLEYERTFEPSRSDVEKNMLDKYRQIMQIVAVDCQPRG
jgi:hypothetical protein